MSITTTSTPVTDAAAGTPSKDWEKTAERLFTASASLEGQLAAKDAQIATLTTALAACKSVLKEWQESERKAREETSIELERATHYRDQWQKALAAGNALEAQFGRHDGCSRWGVNDSLACRRWREAAAGAVGEAEGVAA